MDLFANIPQVILTSLLSVVALFAITKALGHKQMSQLDFFDYITGITIGSIAAELATELETPLEPLLSMLVYGFVSILLSHLTTKFPKSRRFINGSPIILMNNGKLYRNNLKKAKLDLSEFLMMCRQQGYFDLSELQAAVFEYNGTLTLLPTAQKRPINPSDLNLSPKEDTLFTEVIMDGHVIDPNLTHLGFDEKWLQKQLKSHGFQDVSEVFLATSDKTGKISFYPMDVQ